MGALCFFLAEEKSFFGWGISILRVGEDFVCFFLGRGERLKHRVMNANVDVSRNMVLVALCCLLLPFLVNKNG